MLIRIPPLIMQVLLNPDWAKEIPGGQEVKFWGGEACQGLPECGEGR